MDSRADQEKEKGLALAPAEGIAPDFGRLKDGFEVSVRDNTDFFNQNAYNRDTRFAQWSGQSIDGKKHGREGSSIRPTPWEGASDLQVFLTDETINAMVAQVCTAVGRANLVASPITMADRPRATAVTNFMRWLIYTQLPNLDREIELLAQYVYEKGVGVTGQFWEECEDKVLQTVKLSDPMFQQIGITPEILANTELDEQFLTAIEHLAPHVSKKKAKSMLKEMRATGETSLPVVTPRYSRPVIRAFNLDEDLFIHPSATDIENAPSIYRVQYFTAEQLRSFVRTEGWDKDWVDSAIEKLRGLRIRTLPSTLTIPTSRNTVDEIKRFSDLIGVVYAYERLSDEDGVSGIYCSIFNPDLPADEMHDGYAHFGLLGYKHGQYPFTLYRREYLSRRIFDTRGLPEIGKPFQNVVKASRDAWVDAASIGVIPPLAHPAGRAPTDWGPGSKYAYRRDAGEVRYMDRPVPDMNNTVIEAKMVDTWREYNGLATQGGDPTFAQMKQQFAVGKFLKNLSHSLGQIWQLFQQYGDDQVYFQVLGVSTDQMQAFNKGDPRENYQFHITYDVVSNDPAKQDQKWETLTRVLAMDRNGQADYSALFTMAMQSLDPALAQQVVQPKQAATQQAVDTIQTLLTKVSAGIDVDWKPELPAQLGLQVVQGYMQAPDVQQRFQADPAFKARLMKLAQQIQFQVSQQQNAQIGRTGAGPVNYNKPQQ